MSHTHIETSDSGAGTGLIAGFVSGRTISAVKAAAAEVEGAESAFIAATDAAGIFGSEFFLFLGCGLGERNAGLALFHVLQQALHLGTSERNRPRGTDGFLAANSER